MAVSILKQVMEEKLDANNVEVPTAPPRAPIRQPPAPLTREPVSERRSQLGGVPIPTASPSMIACVCSLRRWQA